MTAPKPRIYLLTFSSPPDNRLTTPFCRAVLQALDILEHGGYEKGVLITTSAIAKFYSNGLDLEHAYEKGDAFWTVLYEMWRRFLTQVFPNARVSTFDLLTYTSFPMPTVALLNGHAFAGGLMLATSQDYRLAPSPKGFLCVNELLFGAPLKPAMAALFRTKYPAATFRTMVLEAKRWDAQAALDAGIVDGVAENGNVEDAIKFIEGRGLQNLAKTGVYGTLKAEMYKDLIDMLKSPGYEHEEARFESTQKSEDERKEFGKVWVEQWKKDNKGKAKL